VAVARHLLAPRYATAEAIDDCGVQADNSLPQRLLHSFIVGLGEAEGASEPILMTGPMTAVVDGLGGLVSMILAQRPQPPAELSELAAARAAELLGYLRRNFANPHLTPSMMADDLHISVRYAHKLMQMTGRSFREELVRLRLEAARLAFAAGRRPRQTIADIAISVGFNDLSQFNRHFRAAFGMTPRSARKLDETNGYGSPGDEGGGWTNTVSWRQAPSSPSSLGGAPAMAVASASRPL
jgi:AraC-like DNA-binding protein